MSIKARIWIERQIVTITVKLLLKNGKKLYIDRSEEGDSDRQPILDASPANIDEIMACDDEWLFVGSGPLHSSSWVRFVYGNDGWDVICDYTTDLENILAPVIKLAMDEDMDALIAATR